MCGEAFRVYAHMSNILSLYQSSTQCVSLSLTDDSGAPVNASGALLYFTAKRNYSDPIGSAVINKIVTGGASAATGLFTMCFTTGDTSICVDAYTPAGFTLIDVSGNVSPFPIDSFNILPSPMGYAS